jgi:hypothetical protein
MIPTKVGFRSRIKSVPPFCISFHRGQSFFYLFYSAAVAQSEPPKLRPKKLTPDRQRVFGPVKYLSKWLGIEGETALRWFIVVVAALLDPAALLLLLAAAARAWQRSAG